MQQNEHLLMHFEPLHGRLWFYPSEVRKARSDADVLLCGRNRMGREVFDRPTAKRIAQEGKGRRFVEQMRRISGGDESAKESDGDERDSKKRFKSKK